MTSTIWLASYPKSGNTWLRILLANLVVNTERPVDINDLPARGSIASARGPFDDLLLIDSGLLTHDEVDCLRPRVYEELARGAHDDDDAPGIATPAVRFPKVHDAYARTPKGEPLLGGARGADGALVLVRDPRDVAPSLADYVNWSIDDAIAFMNDGDAAWCRRTVSQDAQLRQKLAGWSRHVASWLDQSDIPVHLMRYEDLRTDTFAVLCDALRFASVTATPADVRRAVAFSNFSELQKQEKAKGFCEAAQRPGAKFFRRGESGRWRDDLTPEQVARIEKAHGPMMLRLGYQLTRTEDSMRPICNVA
jgi:aryl sulfotransferase